MAKALLTNVIISTWSGRKLDKNVTKEIDETHNTVNAGRFNKILINLKPLRDIQTISQQIRMFFYSKTLNWCDSGPRILPLTSYKDYVKNLEELKRSWEEAVNIFCQEYNENIEKAKRNLKGLFNPNDYPSDIRNRFNVEFIFLPFPENISTDFRSEVISDSLSDEINKKIKTNVINGLDIANKDLKFRLQENLTKFIEYLSKENAKNMRNVLLENLKESVQMLESYNFSDNKEIKKLHTSAKRFAKTIPEMENLKNDDELRTNTLERAKELEKLLF